jgi:NADH-quinone oxidoreductase subunit C
MDAKEAAEAVRNLYPLEVVEIIELNAQVVVTVKKNYIREIMRFLHDTAGLEFHFLSDLCGADYKDRKNPRFEVVYNLYSTVNNMPLRIKAQVDEDDPVVDSVMDIWTGADWRERECYDMFGIRFKDHPDLRRLLMPEDWEGYPLRKDYPLGSDLGGAEWNGYLEVIETCERNKDYEVR